MNTILLIIQGMLAVMFLMAGVQKSILSVEKLVKSGLNWAVRIPIIQLRFIGISEFLGAIGLILPWALGLFPILTPISATALVLVMIMAAFHHLRFNEGKAILFNAALLILSAFVAYGRFKML
jgi:uncharacterized membrane protein YphA (DoxX/SURF4 family)